MAAVDTLRTALAQISLETNTLIERIESKKRRKKKIESCFATLDSMDKKINGIHASARQLLAEYAEISRDYHHFKVKFLNYIKHEINKLKNSNPTVNSKTDTRYEQLLNQLKKLIENPNLYSLNYNGHTVRAQLNDVKDEIENICEKLHAAAAKEKQFIRENYHGDFKSVSFEKLNGINTQLSQYNNLYIHLTNFFNMKNALAKNKEEQQHVQNLETSLRREHSELTKRTMLALCKCDADINTYEKVLKKNQLISLVIQKQLNTALQKPTQSAPSWLRDGGSSNPDNIISSQQRLGLFNS